MPLQSHYLSELPLWKIGWGIEYTVVTLFWAFDNIFSIIVQSVNLFTICESITLKWHFVSFYIWTLTAEPFGRRFLVVLRKFGTVQLYTEKLVFVTYQINRQNDRLVIFKAMPHLPGEIFKCLFDGVRKRFFNEVKNSLWKIKIKCTLTYKQTLPKNTTIGGE